MTVRSHTYARALHELRCQLLRILKQMSWDAGFKTSKRDLYKFRIRLGKIKIAVVEVKRVVKVLQIRVALHDDFIVFNRVFGLKNTRSVRPWFRKAIKQMKDECLSRVMSI